MDRPYFIVIEGLDGSGKTTQIEWLRDYFQSKGEAVHLTHEPTDLPTGRLIRQVLRKEIAMDPRSLAALFAADRIEHLFNPAAGILAKLAGGYHVIASRYYFSSLAYQGEFMDPAYVASLNRLAKSTLPADLTIFLDLDPAQSMQRIADRREAVELFETEAKLQHVRESFRQVFEVYGADENIRIVDAAVEVAAVHASIVGHVEAL